LNGWGHWLIALLKKLLGAAKMAMNGKRYTKILQSAAVVENALILLTASESQSSIVKSLTC